MRIHTHLRRLTVALLLWPAGLVAQTSTGVILGSVNDQSGAVIQGAKVTVTEVQTGVATTKQTNGQGYFEMPFLPPGQYQLSVEQNGFKRFVRDGLVLDTDQKLEVPVALQPGQVQQTVEVRGETPLLETTTSALGEVVDNRGVVDLPISNRNLLQLTGLVAGVIDRGADVAPATTGAVAFGHWSANGGMTNTNAFMMDGASAQNANMNAASLIPTIDAIEEFKIQTGLMSSEYGRTGAAIIQRHHQIRHQRSARNRLRILEERLAQHQHLGQQSQPRTEALQQHKHLWRLPRWTGVSAQTLRRQKPPLLLYQLRRLSGRASRIDIPDRAYGGAAHRRLLAAKNLERRAHHHLRPADHGARPRFDDAIHASTLSRQRDSRFSL